MRCSNCRKDIDEEVFPPPLTYCPYCGLKLKDTGAEEADTMHFCPHCGKELPGKVSFCPYCGGDIGMRRTTHYAGMEGSEPARHGGIPVIEVPPEERKKRDKLYKQWMKYADLPPEVVPPKDVPKLKPVGQSTSAGRGGSLRNLPILYILLGFLIIVVVVAVVLLLVQ